MKLITQLSWVAVLVGSASWAGSNSSVNMMPGTSAPDERTKVSPPDYPKQDSEKNAKFLGTNANRVDLKKSRWAKPKPVQALPSSSPVQQN